ncbi:hypothetical protein ABT143_08855 [Streptomyces sp. NPDC002033]|uniref:hypothetical protein n=1 Tax=Streptomyces sp. NPDC002033 TaxID=3154533 RepID=UPI003330029A
MSELEVRLQQWRAVRAWLGWQQRQADQAIRDLEAQLAAAASHRAGPRQPASRQPPPPAVVVARPEWTVTSIRTAHGPKPLNVHIGSCTFDDYGKAGVIHGLWFWHNFLEAVSRSCRPHQTPNWWRVPSPVWQGRSHGLHFLRAHP